MPGRSGGNGARVPCVDAVRTTPKTVAAVPTRSMPSRLKEVRPKLKSTMTPWGRAQSTQHGDLREACEWLSVCASDSFAACHSAVYLIALGAGAGA